MRQAGTHRPTGQDQGQMPPDLEVMRAGARQLLDPDFAPAEFPANHAELDTLTLKLRGHVQLLIPEVEQAALRMSKDEVRRYCALACVGEARGKLTISPRHELSSGVAYARRIARVLNALCDHYEAVTSHGT